MTRAKRPETALSDAIRDVLAKTEPGLLLWRNNSGVFGRHHVRAGLGNGSADLVGVLLIHRTAAAPDIPIRIGKFVALEIKVPGEEATPQQRAWLADVREMGGFACVVHSVEEARAAIVRARQGATC